MPDNEPNDHLADTNMLSFGGHLEVLRRMLFRIIAVVMVFAIVVFCFKDKTFDLLLAPSQWDFITYRYIEKFLHRLGNYSSTPPLDGVLNWKVVLLLSLVMSIILQVWKFTRLEVWENVSISDNGISLAFKSFFIFRFHSTSSRFDIG